MTCRRPSPFRPWHLPLATPRVQYVKRRLIAQDRRNAPHPVFLWICISTRHKFFPFYISHFFSIFQFHLYSMLCILRLPCHLPILSNSSCPYLAYSRHRRDMLSCLLSRGRSTNYVIILVSCDTPGLQGFPAITRILIICWFKLIRTERPRDISSVLQDPIPELILT